MYEFILVFNQDCARAYRVSQLPNIKAEDTETTEDNTAPIPSSVVSEVVFYLAFLKVKEDGKSPSFLHTGISLQ